MAKVFKPRGNPAAVKAHWDAFRAEQRATLSARELAIRDSRRRRQAKWWASLTPEEFADQVEKKHERARRRYGLRKKAKAAE
jgi:hypothetical protein